MQKIANIKNYMWLATSSAYCSQIFVFAPLQEPKHPDLEVFFNIEFDRTGNPNTNIESISRFSCFYALNLIANNCNQKINSHFPM